MNDIFSKIGQGPDLIFLHGWKHDRSTWTQIAERLKQDFTCWLVDLPSFGVNHENLTDKSPYGYAAWVEKFIKEQKINHFSLLGHSFGGRIATIIASRNNKVSKLITYGSPVFNTKDAKAKLFAFISNNLGIRNVPFISKRLRAEDYHQAGELKEIYLEAIKVNLTTEAAQIKIPTLLLWGENDTQAPLETAHQLKKLIVNSQVYVIPKTGHIAHLENPNLFAAKVKEFLINENN